MRRLLAAVLAFLLLGAASASAFTKVQSDAPWLLLGTATDGRSLTVGYAGGGCALGDGRPSVSESAARVMVTVHQTTFVLGEGEGCTTELRHYRLKVPLAAPINGRKVEGGPSLRGIFRTDFFPASTVPRVVGLDREDALAALRGQRLRSSTVSRVRRGMVVRQRPQPGTPVPLGSKPPVIRLRFK